MYTSMLFMRYTLGRYSRRRRHDCFTEFLEIHSLRQRKQQSMSTLQSWKTGATRWADESEDMDYSSPTQSFPELPTVPSSPVAIVPAKPAVQAAPPPPPRVW